MSDTTARWWEVIGLRDEVTSSGGAIDDVQMSLHNAVFGQGGSRRWPDPVLGCDLLRQYHPSDRQSR